jgi:hypothetical protein
MSVRIALKLAIKVTQEVSLVEQELHSLPRHMRSPVFGGIRVARSLVFWVEFCRSLFHMGVVGRSIVKSTKLENDN